MLSYIIARRKSDPVPHYFDPTQSQIDWGGIERETLKKLKNN